MKEMMDKKMPDNEIGGADMPHRGPMAGVEDMHGMSEKDMERGYCDGKKIGSACKSDGMEPA